MLWVSNVPPRHCGPFSDFQLMYHVFTHWLMKVRRTIHVKNEAKIKCSFPARANKFSAGAARWSCSSFGLHHLARHNNSNIGEKLKLMTTRALRSKSRCFLLSPSGTSGLSRQCLEKALRTSKLRFALILIVYSQYWPQCKWLISLFIYNINENQTSFEYQLHHERTEERRKLVAGKKESGKETSASKRFAVLKM